MTDIECVCDENSVLLQCVLFIENLVACRGRVHDVYILKSNVLYVLTQCEYTHTHTQIARIRSGYIRGDAKRKPFIFYGVELCALYVYVCMFSNRNEEKKKS